MVDGFENEYSPEVVSPPGATLQEVLDDCGMKQAELAIRMGRPKKIINEIIKGKRAITPETALQLERVLAIPASFWNNRERYYREFVARREEDERLRAYRSWLRDFPVREMENLGWIEKRDDTADKVKEVVSYLGISSPKQWMDMIPAMALRRSRARKMSLASVAVWLRKGEIEGKKIECSPFDRKRFLEALDDARDLTITQPKEFIPQLRSMCAESGVAVVFVQELPRAHVFGATRWLEPGKALIQLSLLYKTSDQLWFSFFHEAGHIVLHGKRKVFLEVGGLPKEEEAQADQFAANRLIPPAEYRRFKTRSPFGSSRVIRFARMIGIHPGIVVGRLQHDRLLPPSHLNGLKRNIKWEEILAVLNGA
jgi:HTH-type transcriptional regulator/antitoxin HigA